MKRIAWGWLLLVPLVAGCGPGEGTVSGKVTYDGKPLPGGLVTFRPADPRQNPVSVQLDKEGNFPATALPVGEVKVCIDNRELEPVPSFGPAIPGGLSEEAKKALGGGK